MNLLKKTWEQTGRNGTYISFVDLPKRELINLINEMDALDAERTLAEIDRMYTDCKDGKITPEYVLERLSTLT